MLQTSVSRAQVQPHTLCVNGHRKVRLEIHKNQNKLPPFPRFRPSWKVEEVQMAAPSFLHESTDHWLRFEIAVELRKSKNCPWQSHLELLKCQNTFKKAFA